MWDTGLRSSGYLAQSLNQGLEMSIDDLTIKQHLKL